MARPLALNQTFLPPTYGVLKSLLENPLKLPLHHEDGCSAVLRSFGIGYIEPSGIDFRVNTPRITGEVTTIPSNPAAFASVC